VADDELHVLGDLHVIDLEVVATSAAALALPRAPSTA
jgi:hypothetical protein